MDNLPKDSQESNLKTFYNQQKATFVDLFIPSEENNYYPKSLNPRRLAFYALTALVIKVIVVAIVILYPLSAWLTPDILTNESKRILELTNQIRQSNGLQTLKENNNLTASATQKVQDMIVNQYFAHISPDNSGLIKWLENNNYQYTTAGENLAMGFMTAEDVVNAWVKSPTHYANLIDPSYKEIGVAMASGYFNNIDTTLAAQHFAAPSNDTIKIKPTSDNKPTYVEPKKETTVTVVPAGSDTVAQEDNKATSTVQIAVVDSSAATTPPSSYEPYIVSPGNNDRLNSRDAMFIVFTPEKSQVSFRVNNLPQVPATTEDGQYQRAQVLLNDGENSVRAIAKNSQGISIRSKEIKVFVDSKTPTYNRPETFVKLSSPVGQKQTILEAQITSDENLSSAEVEVGNYHVNLQKTENEKVWHGSLIIYDRYAKDFFNPVILPTAKFTDLAGNTTITDIDWDKIQPVKTSFLDQYFFIKAQENSSAKPIMNFANNYYRLMLGIFIIALQLNIFIKIKHQQPVAIINAIAVIGLLIWLMLI
jgi:uncharacterized protein YkwD